jgi:signal transduction histidine kinase/CheY-like chemotaxis protein
MHFWERGPSGTVRVLQRLTIVGLLLPWILFAVVAWRDQKTIVEDVGEDGARTVALFREQVGNLFAGHQLLLDMTVARMSGLDWKTIQSSKGLLNEIEVVDRLLDGVSEILLVDADGQVRATSVPSQPNVSPPSVDGQCFMALSKNDVASCTSQPYTDPKTGHSLFSLSRRLENNGAFNGIVQVAISADYLVGLWAAATPSASDIVTMFSTDGTVLAQTQPGSQLQPRLHDIGKTLIGRIRQQNTGMTKSPLFPDGGDWITIFSKIANQPVYVALSRNNSTIMAKWYANLAIYTLIAASVAAGMVAALGIALRQARKERLAVHLWQTEVEEREKAQEQLRQSQKMEGLGKLTGGIAHDFNNLLTVIIGNISLTLKKAIALDAKSQKSLQSALKASESAATLTKGLLAFSRKQILEPTSVNLPRLVEGMQNPLLRTLGPDVRLTVCGDIHLWPAHVDANQMELVVLNLAINARDAMPEGGTLSITASNRASGPDAPQELAKGQYVVMTVSDSGTGMNEATLARAMEPFFTTKDIGQGTGLGLSMMQGVVTQSGGAVRIRSQLGRGTQVEMWLPRALTYPAEANLRAPLLERQEVGVILVCDDNPAVLDFTCDALRAKGYHVLSATSGRMAITTLNENDMIQLLIVDYTMPGMNGAAVIAQVRASHPALPILLMTGNANPAAIQADLAGVELLTKPFNGDQLTERVLDLLGPNLPRHIFAYSDDMEAVESSAVG